MTIEAETIRPVGEKGGVYGWEWIQPAPTLASLKKHIKRYGWDKKKDGYGKYHNIEYRSWKKAREDSVIQVAMRFLPPMEAEAIIREIVTHEKTLRDAHEELFPSDEEE